MMRRGLALAAICLAYAGAAPAQTIAVQAGQAAGLSTESAAGASTQVRLLGEPRPSLRVKVETSWGVRSEIASDVFGTAYPYDRQIEVIESYIEYFSPTARGLRSVRAGRYRLPFGLSNASDDAYAGFLRPPLVRYGGYYALSNGYLEHGASATLGAPATALEVSIGRPADVGAAVRRAGLSVAARGEATVAGVTMGASLVDTTPYLPARFAVGRARFTGVDARWMRSGVQVRGEWLGGRPFDGASTAGGYLDVTVHRPAMGPLTALARAERLDYAGTSRTLVSHRYAAGARLRLWPGASVTAAVTHQRGRVTQARRTALDVGLGYTLRKDY
jgi:hypothetical protein